MRIKEIIKEKGLTVAEVANRMGVVAPALSRVINGNPTVEMLQRISNVLGVHITELFTTDDSTVSGFIKIKGAIHEIHSMEELKRLIADNDNQ